MYASFHPYSRFAGADAWPGRDGAGAADHSRGRPRRKPVPYLPALRRLDAGHRAGERHHQPEPDLCRAAIGYPFRRNGAYGYASPAGNARRPDARPRRRDHLHGRARRYARRDCPAVWHDGAGHCLAQRHRQPQSDLSWASAAHPRRGHDPTANRRSRRHASASPIRRL